MSRGLEYSFLESWDGWDEIDCADLMFYKVKLNDETRLQLIGLIGHDVDLIDSMTLSMQDSAIVFYDETGEVLYEKAIKAVMI